MERLDWSQGEPKDGRAWIQHNLPAKQSLPVLPVVVVGPAEAPASSRQQVLAALWTSQWREAINNVRGVFSEQGSWPWH
jgi:hypothetical protein